MINISKVLPHSEPFILPDQVIGLDLEKGEIQTQKVIQSGDYFLNGHFEHEPIFPGVMLIETMAQSAGILLSQLGHERQTLFLAKVEDVRFKSVVRPGDCLQVIVHLEKAKGRIWKFQSEIRSKDQLVASSAFTLALGGI